jgi:hypothetical protein
LELSKVRWEVEQVKADLQSRIIDVEIRLAWLRLYGIYAICMFIIVLAGAQILSP